MEVTISQTLSKATKIENSELPLKEAFEREQWDLKGLIATLKSYVAIDMSKHISNRTAKQLESLYLSCLDWIEDDYEIIKEL